MTNGVMNKFGNIIRSKREEQEMLLRHLSAELDIDIAMLSKIERGEKIAKREYIHPLAKLFKLDYNELLSLWLADQVFQLVENEGQALQALQIVKKELKNNTKKFK
ncbi:helix-turn-helix domain-containing protein [Tenacibaculum sp. XPcli2-G]|uniref:helix-turn-helix domain-containing protein n=1 Tax=Tenacibaculum sp. XPcli2-G TaxID=2954503 RepID=UPI002097F7D5|nr:helix-turn-helix transcriptional regulator [Tenacibaculum sp. XPcli2-G]MCO7185050.1 helix-turn-helix domain-containing protein [Tenacibaculum sp. XPcli2-G]